jgi:hypothetical protein
MKTKLGVLIFVFLTAMILGAAQPALLFAGGETGGGNFWDPFIDTTGFTGTNVFGTLSIYYNVTCIPNPIPHPKKKSAPCYPCCPCGLGTVTMSYVVRIPYGEDINGETIIHTYEGSTDGKCIGDIGIPGSGGQGDAIMNFLDTAVTNIFGSIRPWKLKAVNNPGISQDSLAFLADIEIAVQ